MPWVCSAGSSILIPSGPSGNHLHVILNDPARFDGYPPDQCVLVGVSTIRKAPYDDTLIIDPGRHPFITNQSYVVYRHARLDSSNKINSHVASQYFIPMESVDDQLLQEITEGVYESRHTPNFIKQLPISN